MKSPFVTPIFGIYIWCKGLASCKLHPTIGCIHCFFLSFCGFEVLVHCGECWWQFVDNFGVFSFASIISHYAVCYGYGGGHWVVNFCSATLCEDVAV